MILFLLVSPQGKVYKNADESPCCIKIHNSKDEDIRLLPHHLSLESHLW